MKKIFLIFSLLCTSSSFAQSLTPKIESAAGGFFVANQGSLAWTLGEVMVETYKQSNGYLTQGFHQPLSILVTGIAESSREIAVYPNPVKDFIHVKISHTGEYRVEIYDLKGIRVLEFPVEVLDTVFQREVDFRDFALALYLVRIVGIQSGKIHSFRIEKI